jgi:murein DD-endopeptidase MepM/ murein hydrolase activator NlpD
MRHSIWKYLRIPFKISPISMFILMSMAQAITHANSLPENHAVNGGISIIPVDASQKPEAFYDNRRIAVIESIKPQQWLLIVGVPLDRTQAIQEIMIKSAPNSLVPFYLSNKFYKTQYLTIEDPRKVDPLPEDQSRIVEETNKLARIFSGFTANNPFKNDFNPPAKGPVSSLFGLKRVYNKKPRPSHTGLDIAAPADAAVCVISQGKVVDTGDYFYTGNTVIVDHGMGVFSLYGHLKEINVKSGEEIQQGTQVGTIGMTGRATGPHLHWSMIVNQTYVDPLLFVPAQFFHDLPKKEEKKA